MKISPGDLLIINESGTIGFVQKVTTDGRFSIHCIKYGTDTKSAWYDFDEATVLVPMSQSLETANKIIHSPLFKALK